MIPFQKIPKPRCEVVCAGPQYDITNTSFDARRKEGFRCKRTAQYLLPDGHKACRGHAVMITNTLRPVLFYDRRLI